MSNENKAKPPLSMISLSALKGASRVMEFGDRKGDRENRDWMKKKIADLDLVSSLLRHCSRFMIDPTSRDKESGLPEIDHMISNLTMLREMLSRDGLLPEDPGPAINSAYDGWSNTLKAHPPRTFTRAKDLNRVVQIKASGHRGVIADVDPKDHSSGQALVIRDDGHHVWYPFNQLEVV